MTRDLISLPRMTRRPEIEGDHEAASITKRLNAVYGWQIAVLDPAFSAAQLAALDDETW